MANTKIGSGGSPFVVPEQTFELHKPTLKLDPKAASLLGKPVPLGPTYAPTFDLFAHDPLSLNFGVSQQLGLPSYLLPSSDGRPVGARVEHANGGPASSHLAVLPGETWTQAIERRYDHPVSPELVEFIARSNNASAAGQPPAVVTIPDIANLYLAQLGVDPASVSEATRTAAFVVVEPGQDWEALVRSHYQVTDEAVSAIGVALAMMNGRSRNEPPGAVTMLPDIKNLNVALRQLLKQQEATAGAGEGHAAVGHGARPDLAAIAHFGGTLDNPTDKPTAGLAYHPAVDDNLRGVVLQAYHDQLMQQGMSSEQADRRAQDYMLAVATLNGLHSMRLDGVTALYLPDVVKLDATIASQKQKLDAARTSGNPLVKAILTAGTGIRLDVVAQRVQTAGVQQPVDINAAITATTEKRNERAVASPWTSLSYWGWPLAFAFEYATDPVPAADQALIPEQGESAIAFVSRNKPLWSVTQQVEVAATVAHVRTELAALPQVTDSTMTVQVAAGEDVQVALTRMLAGIKSESLRVLILNALLDQSPAPAADGSYAFDVGQVYEATLDARGAWGEGSLSLGPRGTERSPFDDLREAMRTQSFSTASTESASDSSSSSSSSLAVVDSALLALRADPGASKLTDKRWGELKAHVQAVAAQMADVRQSTATFVERVNDAAREKLREILRRDVQHMPAATDEQSSGADKR